MDDNSTFETENNSIGKEVAKTLIISTASSAGVILGMAAAGLAYAKFEELKEKRRAKKDAKNES